jgi:2-dehydro-3-deoxyphosphogluconate aldolase/(4S)-4-hydroxy-2-oxoglutarate aldolase
MQTEEQSIQKVKELGLLPLYYHDNPEVCLSVAKALYDAGVRCIEFTNRGAHAFENFKRLVKTRDESMKELVLAVGTIKTGTEAQKYIDAGADFLISPVFDNSVCDTAYLNKVLWIPGCTTPTEIHVAEKAGCKLIKLFPGNLLGPGYVEAILPLFQGLDFVVTGGVDTTEENIKAWFKAGVVGVGMGSKLIGKDVLQEEDYDGLKTKTRKVISIIRKIKSARLL